MLPPWVIYVGAVAGLTGSLTYVRAVLAGRARPNRASWTLWTLAPMLAFAAQLDEGVGLPALTTFVVGFGPALVLTASFFTPAATWRLGRFDYLCAALAATGLAAWALTSDGGYAIAFGVLADATAAAPTVRKAWRHPETESPSVYVGAAVNGGLALSTFTLGTVTWQAAAFPVYLLLVGTTLALLATREPLRPSAATAVG